MNLGDVIAECDSLYGGSVTIAPRVQSQPDSGGIYVSCNIYLPVEERLPLTYHYIGEQTVKNIAKPVRVSRVSIQEIDEHLLSITWVEIFATNWRGAPRGVPLDRPSGHSRTAQDHEPARRPHPRWLRSGHQQPRGLAQPTSAPAATHRV